MRFSQIGVVAALAVADAFLLPPEISAADTDIIKTLPFEDAVAVDGRVMEINCPGCPVMTDIEDKMHSTQADSVLKLNFKLVHAEQDRLYLNNLQIYPMNPSADNFFEPLTAPQMIKTEDNTWEYSSSPKLGYAIHVAHPVSRSNQDQLDLVSIHIEIIEVADKYLPAMPIVEIKLLETPSHKLMIGDAIIKEPQSQTPSKPTDDEQECTTILCKWRAIFADRLSKLKGCGSKARPSGQVVPAHKTHGHHGRPHPHGPRPNGPHRPYRHHHKHHGITRFLKGIVLHVVIPVLIGVMVGITASLLGMIVGHIVIFIWRTLFRRGQRQQYIKVQQEEIVVEDVTDENKGLMEHQGPPPVYEEVVVVEKASE
jgi:hypothetical protein